MSSRDQSVNGAAQAALKKEKDPKDSDRLKLLKYVLEQIYHANFQPDQKCLEEYITSDDFEKQAKTARVYYNAEQLTPKDAKRVLSEREPTAIEMRPNQYNEQALYEKFIFSGSLPQ